MKKSIVKKLLVVAIFLNQAILAFAQSDSPDLLPAQKIAPDCRLQVSKYGYDPMDFEKYNLSINWQCKNSRPYVIDSYAAAPTGPRIVTVFYTKKRDVIVLVKWPTKDQKATNSAHYKVFGYRYVGNLSDAPFVKLDHLSEQFGDGYDEIINGEHTEYPFKNAAAIRKRLKELGE
jgi:hypothetical protein